MIPATLRHFQPSEFSHFDLCDPQALVWLDDLRDLYGFPLELTSAARTEAENQALPDSSPTSLHLVGRAFDVKWIVDPERRWRFVEALYLASGDRAVELELVPWGPRAHVHIGLFPEGTTESRLLVRPA